MKTKTSKTGKYKIGDYVLCQVYEEPVYGRKIKAKAYLKNTPYRNKIIRNIRVQIIGKCHNEYAVLLEKTHKICDGLLIDRYSLDDYAIGPQHLRKRYGYVASKYILGLAPKLKCKICRKINFDSTVRIKPGNERYVA